MLTGLRIDTKLRNIPDIKVSTITLSIESMSGRLVGTCLWHVSMTARARRIPAGGATCRRHVPTGGLRLGVIRERRLRLGLTQPPAEFRCLMQMVCAASETPVYQFILQLPSSGSRRSPPRRRRASRLCVCRRRARLWPRACRRWNRRVPSDPRRLG